MSQFQISKFGEIFYILMISWNGLYFPLFSYQIFYYYKSMKNNVKSYLRQISDPISPIQPLKLTSTVPTNFFFLQSSIKIRSHSHSNTKSKWSLPDLSPYLPLLLYCSKWPGQAPVPVHRPSNPRQKRDLRGRKTSAPSNWANWSQCDVLTTPLRS